MSVLWTSAPTTVWQNGWSRAPGVRAGLDRVGLLVMSLRSQNGSGGRGRGAGVERRWGFHGAHLAGLKRLRARHIAQRTTQLREWCAKKGREVMDIADSVVFNGTCTDV